MRKKGKYRFGWLILLLMVAGCSAVDELFDDGVGGITSADPEESTTGGGQPDLVYDGPQPASEAGNVYGRIIWNSSAAADLEVLLCADFSAFSGCAGDEYFSQTDVEGDFLFSDIPPGEYSLSVRIFNTDEWLYIGGGIFSAAEFEVEAGETLVLGVQNIYKLDLDVAQPPPAARVAETELKLDWDDYPGADFYRIYLTPDKGDALLVNERVNESEFTLELRPINCEYRWKLEAFNADRVKIAESGEYFTFILTEQDTECALEITAPLDGEIVRGSEVLLDWEPNGIAVEYEILLWNDDDPGDENILNFEKVNESQFRLDIPLAPGRHVWSVSAVDENGERIAGSEIFDFIVEE